MLYVFCLLYSVVTSSRSHHHRVGGWGYEAGNPRYGHHLSSSPDITYPDDRRVEPPLIIVRNKQHLKPPRYVQWAERIYLFVVTTFIYFFTRLVANPGVVVRIVLVHLRVLHLLEVIREPVVHVVRPRHLALSHSCHAVLVQIPHYPISLLQAIGI